MEIELSTQPYPKLAPALRGLGSTQLGDLNRRKIPHLHPRLTVTRKSLPYLSH